MQPQSESDMRTPMKRALKRGPRPPVMHWNDVIVPPFRNEFHFWLEQNGTSSISKNLERNDDWVSIFHSVTESNSSIIA